MCLVASMFDSCSCRQTLPCYQLQYDAIHLPVLPFAVNFLYESVHVEDTLLMWHPSPYLFLLTLTSGDRVTYPSSQLGMSEPCAKLTSHGLSSS
jgi:hypothetical protein